MCVCRAFCKAKVNMYTTFQSLISLFSREWSELSQWEGEGEGKGERTLQLYVVHVLEHQ